MQLPAIRPGMSVLAAALRYAEAGWYVLPVKRGDYKNPGSVVGNGWQKQSSTDPGQLQRWFSGTPHGIALHMGPSGVLTLDVDAPHEVPEQWWPLLDTSPFQNSNPATAKRGHYPFTSTEVYLNKRYPWGEVRSGNAVIIAAPSAHEKHATGSAYRWVRGGLLSPAPGLITASLETKASRVATDAVAGAGQQSEEYLHALHALDEVAYLREGDHPGGLSWEDSTRAGMYIRLAELAAAGTDVRLNPLWPAEFQSYVHKKLQRTVAPRPDGGFGPGGTDLSAVLAEQKKQEPEVEVRSETQDAPEPVVTEPSAYDRAVETELLKMRIRKDAQAALAALENPPVPPEPFDHGLLVDVLARPAGPPMRVEGLVPSEAGVLLVAQRKTGKTTFCLNYARSLLTGTDFLGRFPVVPLSAHGRVAFLNFEVSGAQLARWADEVGVPQDRFLLVNLRGRRNPLKDPDDRQALADLLRAHQVEVVLVDPFGRAFTGTDQNSAGEVGAWLVDLDLFVRAEVGATDLVLTAHAGWNGERSRGSTALEDWADSIITLVKDTDSDDAPVYVRAIGRDVDLDEDVLVFDPATRSLSLGGQGTRKQARQVRKLDSLMGAVVAVLSDEGGPFGLSVTAVEKELTTRAVAKQKGDTARALKTLVERGLVSVETGSRNARLHRLVSVSPPATPTPPDLPRRGGSPPTPTPPIGAGWVDGELGAAENSQEAGVAQSAPGGSQSSAAPSGVAKSAAEGGPR